jgi:hypothetical protein
VGRHVGGLERILYNQGLKPIGQTDVLWQIGCGLAIVPGSQFEVLNHCQLTDEVNSTLKPFPRLKIFRSLAVFEANKGMLHFWFTQFNVEFRAYPDTRNLNRLR